MLLIITVFIWQINVMLCYVMYMHNHDEKYSSRPGFEPGTPRLQAPVDTNELSGPASIYLNTCHVMGIQPL